MTAHTLQKGAPTTPQTTAPRPPMVAVGLIAITRGFTASPILQPFNRRSLDVTHPRDHRTHTRQRKQVNHVDHHHRRSSRPAPDRRRLGIQPSRTLTAGRCIDRTVTSANPLAQRDVERKAKETQMSTKDKMSNTAQDVKGKVKEIAGKAVGNRDLENKGKADQAKSAVKDVGEKVKDAAAKVKHAATGD